MKPFFTYYGGKWRSALRYPRPQLDYIVEPFAGAAGYSVRHNAQRVTLVDSDPYIAGTWAYLIRASREEILSLPDLPIGGTVDDLEVCQEARWLIGWWLNKGASAPRKSPSRWMREGIRPRSFWGVDVRERLAAQVDHIRHWQVLHQDYHESPELDATWFVDPPYRRGGQHYRHSEINYGELAAWCRSRKGQVIVCESSGADWLPFEPAYTGKATSGKQKSSATCKEVVWLSSPANDEESVA